MKADEGKIAYVQIKRPAFSDSSRRPLPTKIGGDLNFIARELTFQFHRPVFVGDTIDCEVTLMEWEHG